MPRQKRTTIIQKAGSVKKAFNDIRMGYKAERNQNKIVLKPSENASTGTISTSVHDLIWQQKADFEEKIGISVSDGAYNILEKEKFLPNIATLICSILKEILDNGVVTNKELLLKEADKGIILRNITTKNELLVLQLKHF